MNNKFQSYLDAFVCFFEEEYAKQKDHLILWWPICLGIGVAIYFSLRDEPSLFLCFMLAVSAGVGAYSLKRAGRWIFVVLFALSLISLGVSVGAYRTQSIDAPVLKKEIKFARVVGTIHKVALREKGVKRLFIEDLEIENLSKNKTPYRIQLTMRQKQDVEVGQRLSFLASLRPPSAPVIPRGFDFQRFFFFKKIGATGYIMSDLDVVRDAESVHVSFVGKGLFDIAEVMKSLVLLNQSIANPIVTALLTGDRAAVDEVTWDHLRDSGLSHMLAISGLHVGLFSATVFFFVRFFLSLFPMFTLTVQTKKVAALFAFSAALFYTLLVGASVPTVRACLMTGMFLLAIVLDRSPFSVHLLAFAAFVVLVIFPESLMSASFQMSFGAVMGLVIFYASTRAFWVRQYSHTNPLRKLFVYLLSICATTIIATIATLPFTLYHFQHVAVYGLLGNILAVPLMGFIVMPMAVFSYALLPIGLAEYPLAIMRFGVEGIITISSWVASLDGASLSIPTIPFVSFCLSVVGGLMLLTIRGACKFLCVVPLLLAVCIAVLSRPADVFLSEDGKLWGLYKDHSLYVSDSRKGRFVKQQWMDYLAYHEGKPLSVPMSGCLGDVCCDEDACRTNMNGYQLSFLRGKYEVKSECRTSDILIAPFSVKSCDGSTDIDWYDFYYRGAHMIWLNDDHMILKTVQERRGSRPWVLSNSE